MINFPGIDTRDEEQCAKVLVSFDGAEGRTRPYEMTKVAKFVGLEIEKLLLQPEGYNPSGSFKDNGMATGFTHAKMLGVIEVICASAGNTSASLGMYAANEMIQAIVYVPRGQIAPGKLGQAFHFGSYIIEVDGNFDDCLRIVLDEGRKGKYVMNSVNAFRLEGQKTIIYRALEYLDWQTPDWIFVPGGNLGNTAAFGKALEELYRYGWIAKIPRIVVVNAEGANTLYTLYNGRFGGTELRWNKGKINFDLIEEFYEHKRSKGIKASTEASAIKIDEPVNLTKALRTLEFTNGIVTQVSDREMFDGMAVVGLNGFDCELASGAVPAAIKKLVEEETIDKDDTVIGILTGRQKDPSQTIAYHQNPRNTFARPSRKYFSSHHRAKLN